MTNDDDVRKMNDGFEQRLSVEQRGPGRRRFCEASYGRFRALVIAAASSGTRFLLARFARYLLSGALKRRSLMVQLQASRPWIAAPVDVVDGAGS
jgi:hypothetical protein